MKDNQVFSIFKGFKFIKNYFLMNYKLNKILSQTSKSNADISHTNSWGHKLYLKGTQAWDNFEFFLTYLKSLYALRKFSKKISLLFLRFSPEFRCSNISVVTEHTRNKIFLMSYPNFFFFKIFTLVLLDEFLDGFWKFWLFIFKNLHFYLVFLCIFRKL